ncbi:uncharacterized protein LOC131814851 isoform X3 [Mustela lutreola]|uniref:uncharacterized protein LOC131814851 isoform X3 n=1 Tax=Mustela lutreola TaxID=9666 RepID=UPI002797A084|nr:uncharacterized protein LOC131814851 isoform X3 [Mustela lutreola]
MTQQGGRFSPASPGSQSLRVLIPPGRPAWASQAQAESAGRRPAMGPGSEDPHLCRASWLLRFTSLLLSVCSAVTQSPGARGSAVDDSGNPVTLKGAQGTPVLFQVIRNPELPPEFELEKMSWGIVSRSNYIVMLYVFPGRDVPEWVNFQDKFERRVYVLNIMTLRIVNLTLEDSGLYRARESYTRGRQYDQDFHLTVYETDPQGQTGAAHLSGILVSVVVVLLILGAGLYLWKTCGKKNVEPGRGRDRITGRTWEHDRCIHSAELSQQESGDHRDKGMSAFHI